MNTSATPANMLNSELEILFQAASTTGVNAGRIKLTPPGIWNTLSAGSMHWRFSYDAASKEGYREALDSLVRQGYVATQGEDDFIVTDEGHEIAEECCHEWWRRRFEEVRVRRGGRVG